MKGSIGALFIGQTPRADLTDLLHVPPAYDLKVWGALDGCQRSALPDAATGTYPLVTQMRNGAVVTVDEGFLEPLLQEGVDKLEQQGVVLTVLLCAGPFYRLHASKPLLRPFQLAAQVLAQMGVHRLGIVVPTDAQQVPAERKWTKAGFHPVLWSMEAKDPRQSLDTWLAAHKQMAVPVDALVFDYVGYPAAILNTVQQSWSVPVLDLGHLAAAALAAMLTP